ncbi:MAG: hypothetical protein MJH10_11335 [Epibacterium sp.]|nr:hypothetical protein [Epibacterium sp.]NQX74140.1 hypothetical protein [Epibacterium sp.]
MPDYYYQIIHPSDQIPYLLQTMDDIKVVLWLIFWWLVLTKLGSKLKGWVNRVRARGRQRLREEGNG